MMNQQIQDLVNPESYSLTGAFNSAVEIPSNQYTLESRSRVERFTSKLEEATIKLKKNKTKVVLGAGGVLFLLALLGDN